MGLNIRQRCALALFSIALAAGVGDSAPRLIAQAGPSPNGTELPPATQIVDAMGAVWTLGSDLRVLRNGVHAAGGYGRLINYSQQTVYVYGGDRWWQWTGSGWSPYTPTQLPQSPDGTELPPATQIVDATGAVWTLASDLRVLRNGVHAAGGYGRLINYSQQTVYVWGGDSRWWRWTGSGWTPHTPVAQGPSPSGTAVPPASQVVDDGGNVWTLASDRRVLRNGVHAGGGYGTSILWLSQTVYVLGTDGVWWYRWSGTGWAPYGQTAPGTVPAVAGDYYVSPGQNIQPVLSAALEGQTIVLRAGVHRMQTLHPKSAQVIVGEPGAILSGARLLTGFGWTGSHWMIPGQTQQGSVIGVASDLCAAAAPFCVYPEDLFLDDLPLLRAASLAQVTAGKWYFDYAADRIYMADNPTGRKVETSVTPVAVHGYGQNVTLRGLTIEKYATPTGEAAVNDTFAGWIVEDCDIRWNHFAGVRTADWTIVRRSNVHHNGAFGFLGSGNGATVDNNEIAYNNALGYNAYWGAGGAKFVNTNGLVLKNNFVHHNDGPGLHTDIDNINVLVEWNRVEDNNLSGIFHEVGYRAIIRNNTVARNGRLQPWPYWVDGAGILVSASPDVEVYGNTLTDNWQGIAGLAWTRGSGRYGELVLRNLYVHDNAVYQTAPVPGGGGRTGIVDREGTAAFFANNRFVHNSYWLGASPYYFMWMGNDVNENTWRAYNQDATGSFTR